MSNVYGIDRFFLRRLPFLAFDQVLKSMPFFETINFSKTSVKTKGMVKCFCERYLKNYKFGVGIQKEGFIFLKSPSSEYQFESYTSKESEECRNYVEDMIAAVKNCSEYVLNLLECGIDVVSFDVKAYPSQNRSIIDWAVSKSARSWEIESEESDDEAIKYLLENVKSAEKLVVALPITESFEFPQIFPVVTDRLYFDEAHWIGLDQLMRIQCPNIAISYSNLTNTELKAYFKHWMDQSSEIQSFECFIDNPDSLDMILEGLPTVKIEETRTFKKKNSADLIEVCGGIDVTRPDGVTATFYIVHEDLLKMFVH